MKYTLSLVRKDRWGLSFYTCPVCKNTYREDKLKKHMTDSKLHEEALAWFIASRRKKIKVPKDWPWMHLSTGTGYFPEKPS